MYPELKAFLSSKLDKYIKTVPNHMQGSVYLYVLERVEPGGFLRAVFENNLTKAVACADDINRANIVQWAEFCMWAVPSACQGSPEKVSAWLAGNDDE